MVAWRMSCDGPGEQLDEFRVVHDFGPLRDRREIRAARRAFRPWRRSHAVRETPGSGEISKRGDARAEAFGFALAGVEREPDGDFGGRAGCASRYSRSAAGESSAA